MAHDGRNGERKMFLDEATGELRPSCKETNVNSLAKSRFCRESSGCMKEHRRCLLDEAVVEIGEKGVFWKVRWEQATVPGKLRKEGVH